MNISAPFIQRPIATSLLTVALLLAGIVAFPHIPVAPLPEVEYPTISVFAQLPGASPETVATSIATPLERMFGRIAGINQMTSSSSLGGTNIVLQFDLSRNADAAARDVQAAINAARGELPANLPTNPNWRKVNPAEAPVMVLTLTSDTATNPQMYDVADSILAQKIQQIPGVGVVNLQGSSKPAVRAEMNPLQLSKMGVGLAQVGNALNAANSHSPKGGLADSSHGFMINDNDQLYVARDYAPLIVAYKNGAPVRLSDVATVLDAGESNRNLGLAEGKPSVQVEISRQPQANIIATVDQIRALLPYLRASIPASIHLAVVQDRTTTIRASVHDVEVSLIISVALVIFVVFVFLRNLSATSIPSVAVPLSLVGTFGVMYLLGYTIDNLSLMALTISTGFVVDDAIVVIENITRYMEMGHGALEAALKGSEEIGFTVLSMSTSLIAVFVPILLMGGIVGRIFREFAVTLSVAVTISMVVSLTATPMMCSILLKEQKGRKHSWIYRANEAAFEWIREGYAASLRWVLRNQPVVLGITLGTICLAVYLYVIVPKGFFPQQDTGRINGNARASEDISFQSMKLKQAAYNAIIMNDPDVDTVYTYTGGNHSANTANFNITLKPLSQRKVTVDQWINRMRPKLARVPGATLFLQPVQDVQIGGRASNAQFQYTLLADNVPDLLKWSPIVEGKLKRVAEIRDVSSDLRDRGLQAGVIIDRDTASRLGISASLVDDTLYSAFGQKDVSVLYEPTNQYHVLMEIDPKFQQTMDSLGNIYFNSSNGPVPLSAFSHYRSSYTALSVAHQGPFPAVTISFNLAPNVTLGDAVTAVQNAVNTMVLPGTIHPSFQGTAQAFQDSLRTEPYLILAALVTVYIVLGCLYENFVHPITIISTLPSAGVGALLALLVFRTELSIIALIGIILLIGIVKKNAILMIDFALHAEREEGNSPRDSIYRACLLRFRPILMTTMAAMFGGLPIALGTGNGAEFRRPLGIAIVGGLLFSQLLTLYTTPVVYLYLDRFRALISGGKKLRPLAVDSAVTQVPSASD